MVSLFFGWCGFPAINTNLSPPPNADTPTTHTIFPTATPNLSHRLSLQHGFLDTHQHIPDDFPLSNILHPRSHKSMSQTTRWLSIPSETRSLGVLPSGLPRPQPRQTLSPWTSGGFLHRIHGPANVPPLPSTRLSSRRAETDSIRIGT